MVQEKIQKYIFIIYLQDLDADTLATTTSLVRDERGVILYASNLLGSRGPRKMTVIFPKVKSEEETVVWRPIKTKDGILEKYFIF